MVTEYSVPQARPSCGTQGGYNLHKYHGEPACGACKRAHSTYTNREARSIRLRLKAITAMYEQIRASHPKLTANYPPADDLFGARTEKDTDDDQVA